MRTTNPRVKPVVGVLSASATSRNVSTDSESQHDVVTKTMTAAPSPSAALAGLPDLESMLAGAALQCQANAGWHAVAGAASCGAGILIGVAARLLAGQWLLGGLDLALVMSPAGVFFQAARKCHDNARHFQALKMAVQAALAMESVGGTPIPMGDPDERLGLMKETTFHAPQATWELRILRAKAIDLLNQINGAGPPSEPPLVVPARLEFLGQVEPKRFVVRADGIDIVLTRAQYRMLLAIALRRVLHGDKPPRGADPGSFYNIGDRRNHPIDIEARFREKGFLVLDEDGRGTKLRRIACAPEAIEVDGAAHLGDNDIVEDGDLAALLRAFGSHHASVMPA